MGLAAFVCSHGFVVSMASLLTEENFVYYGLLLQAASQKMDLGRSKAIFMDIACYYSRCVHTATRIGDGCSQIIDCVRVHRPAYLSL